MSRSIALASPARPARTRALACLAASRSPCGVVGVVALASGMPEVGGGAYAIDMGTAAACAGGGVDALVLSRAVTLFVFLSGEALSCACLADFSEGLSELFLSAVFLSEGFLS